MNKKVKKIISISVLSVLVISIPVSAIIIGKNKSTPLYDVDIKEEANAYSLLKDTMSNKTYTYYDFKLENPLVNYTLPSKEVTCESVNPASDTYIIINLELLTN